MTSHRLIWQGSCLYSAEIYPKSAGNSSRRGDAQEICMSINKTYRFLSSLIVLLRAT